MVGFGRNSVKDLSDDAFPEKNNEEILINVFHSTIIVFCKCFQVRPIVSAF